MALVICPTIFDVWLRSGRTLLLHILIVAKNIKQLIEMIAEYCINFNVVVGSYKSHNIAGNYTAMPFDAAL